MHAKASKANRLGAVLFWWGLIVLVGNWTLYWYQLAIGDFGGFIGSMIGIGVFMVIGVRLWNKN